MNNIKILVVDDEEGVLEIFTDIFHHYDITTESSPRKAIELLRMQPYDIFIVDYQMPVINGIELLETIKEEYNNRNYVSIFCTAYGTIHLFKNELISGLFNFFVEKPFEVDLLSDVVKRAVVTLEHMKSRC